MRSLSARGSARAATLVGLAVFAFLALGFYALTQRTINPGWLEGTIVGKSFTPQAEQQIDVGAGGVRSREVKGTYRLSVKGDDGREYTIFVSEPIYTSNREGARFRFQRPPPDSASSR